VSVSVLSHFVLIAGFDHNFFLVMHGYPGIFAVAGFCRTVVVAYRVLSAWSQTIRDKEFLVEMRLRNLEPEKANIQGETGQRLLGIEEQGSTT
jgi:hypothetical protein